jgi:hypothetical protein
MIGLPAGTRVWLAAGATDMRKLKGAAATKGLNPFCFRAAFEPRRRRGIRI